jgi:hypothetical protein
VADLVGMPSYSPSVSERVQSGFFVILLSSCDLYHVAQAQRIMENVAYLESEFFCSDLRAFSFLPFEPAIQFWIPYRSVPLHVAGW